MRVLFDHQIFSYQRFGGASRYYHELINVLSGQIDVELGVATSPNEYLAHASYYRGKTIAQGGTARFLATYARNEVATRLAARHHPDVLHATFYDPLVAHHRGKLVVTVLDMIPEHFPDFFDTTSLYGRFVTKRWIEGKRTLCERADKILAISENTKQDVVTMYGIAPERITVTHLGNRLRGGGPRPEGFPDRYVLFVGTRNTYKNFDVLLQAVAPLGLPVVAVGGGPLDDKERARIAQLGVTVVQRNVRDDELAGCYANAYAYVFPSRYEGFGIPILEAFACGAPTIVANASCFPEIAGDAALYFDPDDVAALTAHLCSIPDRAAHLIAAGQSRAAQFTWEATAARTLDVYREIA